MLQPKSTADELEAGELHIEESIVIDRAPQDLWGLWFLALYGLGFIGVIAGFRFRTQRGAVEKRQVGSFLGSGPGVP